MKNRYKNFEKQTGNKNNKNSLTTGRKLEGKEIISDCLYS